MALGETIFNGIPSVVWVLLHSVAALIGIYVLVRLHLDKPLTWAFILFVISSSLFVLVFLDIVDFFAIHVLSTAALLISFILMAKHAHICCR